MKKIFACIITITLFLSCSKDEKVDPQVDAFSAFRGKYLVCESVKTTINGRSTTVLIGKGKGMDMTFGLYGNLDIYTSPATSKKYQFEAPNKIYYWTTNYDSSQYYTIESMSGNKIVLINTDQASGTVMTENFTAE